MRVGSAAARLIKLRQRQRHAELEAPRLLRLRDRDRGKEGFLGRRGVRRITFEQDLAVDPMQKCVRSVFSRLLRQRDGFVDPGRRSFGA